MSGVSSYCRFIFKGAVVLGLLTVYVNADTVFEALRRDSQLSKFFEMVNNDDVTRVTIQGRTVTVFAPINQAVHQVEDRVRNKEKEVAEYHILIQLARKDIFPSAAFTFLSGGAPLYLTYRNKDRYGQKDYYVNNAKILRSSEHQSKDGSRQLLYVIDEVLEPYVPSTSFPPDAMEFLNQPGIYSIDQSLSVFASRVRSQNQEKEFRRIGNHTFFLPVGATDVDSMNRLREIDQEVIGGHVIPNQVLFTRVMGSENYPTATYNNSIKVEISLINETSEHDHSFMLKVKSNTLDGNDRHKKGVVLSRIVRANIPVKNGVVHLIDLPLMIIDVSVWSFLQNEQDGRLSKFNNLINYSPDFRYELQSQGEKTLCAPNNEALELMGEEKLREIQGNMSLITQLLQMHMVREAISSDDVRTGRKTEALTMDRVKKLYFRVLGDDRNRTLYVQGGGVNAVAVQADIGATDGIIHIIDRVLGMPYLTVYETLRETPTEVNETYQLGQQNDWIQKLGDRSKKFTFFAPSNEAWQLIHQETPTSYKQLKMSLYTYQAGNILDRHLIVGEELNMRTLETMNDLQMVHGKFKIEKTYNDIHLVWEGIRARIVRPDVQATNGIIHIIDRVMMKDRDLTTSTAVRGVQVFHLLVLLLLAAMRL